MQHEMSLSRRQEIAERVFALHEEIKSRSFELWDGRPPAEEVRLLEPMVAFELLGYEARTVDYLGEDSFDGNRLEVAGLLDTSERVVQVSLRFSKEEQLFTAAHELGHVVLHPERMTLHRDRPLKGSDYQRDLVEREADWFAVCFLMPPELVRDRFQQVFGIGPFQLTDETAFALISSSLEQFMSVCRSQRDLARTLAETNSYGGRAIMPLKKFFGVSTTAMAIRLEELALVAPLPQRARIPAYLKNGSPRRVAAR